MSVDAQNFELVLGRTSCAWVPHGRAKAPGSRRLFHRRAGHRREHMHVHMAGSRGACRGTCRGHLVAWLPACLLAGRFLFRQGQLCVGLLCFEGLCSVLRIAMTRPKGWCRRRATTVWRMSRPSAQWQPRGGYDSQDGDSFPWPAEAGFEHDDAYTAKLTEQARLKVHRFAEQNETNAAQAEE